MMNCICAASLSVLVLASFAASPAFAQSAAPVQATHDAPAWTFTASAGRAIGTGGGDLFAVTKTRNSRTGLLLDVAVRSRSNRISFVAEGAGFDAVSAAVGLRMTSKGAKVRGFAQMLVGIVQLTLEQTAGAIQPGAGVEVTLSQHIGWKVQVDYRYLTSESHHASQVRMTVGIVVSKG